MRRSGVLAGLLLGAMLTSAFLPPTVAQAACGFSRVASPNKGKTDNFLLAVDAASPDLAWAAGTVDDPVSNYGLTQTWRWDGRTWKLVPTPVPPKAYTVNVNDVAALRDGEAWVVGNWQPSSFATTHPLLMHYSGGAWHVLRGPKSLEGGAFVGIDARGPADVWAAGNGPGGMFVWHWDGARWHRLPQVPDVGTTSSALQDITAVPGSKTVWTTGVFNGPPSEGAMFHRWNGKKWSTFLGNQVASQVHPYAIDAGSATDVTAVGYVTDQVHTWGGIGYWFNGGAWADTPVVDPSLAFPGTFLYGVSVVGSHSYAVGTTTDGSGEEALTVQVWDGVAWTGATTPALMPTNDAQAVSRIPGTKKVWIAGNEFNGTRFRTVILRGC